MQELVYRQTTTTPAYVKNRNNKTEKTTNCNIINIGQNRNKTKSSEPIQSFESETEWRSEEALKVSKYLKVVTKSK